MLKYKRDYCMELKKYGIEGDVCVCVCVCVFYVKERLSSIHTKEGPFLCVWAYPIWNGRLFCQDNSQTTNHVEEKNEKSSQSNVDQNEL